MEFVSRLILVVSHPTRGAWIEMILYQRLSSLYSSHPTRGAWIEISVTSFGRCIIAMSHPTRGAWIEIRSILFGRWFLRPSHPTRGAWIEIWERPELPALPAVAPYPGCVD